MIIYVKDIPFELLKWDFQEDGEFGAIYFTVPGAPFARGSNNGASFNGLVVRCATPCMENSVPGDIPFNEYVEEAARFAYDNLSDARYVR